MARDQAASAIGISKKAVTVHTTLMGGGFGRRAEVDYAVLAAKVAAAVPNVPVQVTWSREEDMRHDHYRPASVARFQGVVENGTIAALEGRIAAPSITSQAIKRWPVLV